MTIEQTVEIPPSRRLFIDVPPEVPVGRTVLTFTPASPVAINKENPHVEEKGGVKSATPHSDRLSGILSQPTPRADSLLGIFSDVGDITLEQIREERLAKYLE